jgi:SAM-dependent methyltransferase
LSFPGPKIGGLPRIPAPDVRSVTCEHPLAYLLGIEGLALLRGFTGEFDREFVEARLAEVRRLLDDDSLTEAVTSERLDSVPGYEIWAETYDNPGNAACGTGRYTRILAGRGHRVIGVDSSPAMLAKASGGDFRLGSRAGPTGRPPRASPRCSSGSFGCPRYEIASIVANSARPQGVTSRADRSPLLRSRYAPPNRARPR